MRHTFNTAINIGRITRDRFVRHGARSAAVCSGTFALNFALKLRNRMGIGKPLHCPLCGWRGPSFLALDIGQRALFNIECPVCHTHDRHRLITLAWRRGLLGDLERPGIRALHCAPEPAISALLTHAVTTNTDISVYPLKGKPRACAANGETLPFAEASFDLVVSLHVLEHIPIDRNAIREYHRVLRPGGTALIMAPMLDWIPATEDWGKPNPEMFDHYRTYSTHDVAERFAPFAVRLHSAWDTLSLEDRTRYAVRKDEHLLVCVK